MVAFLFSHALSPSGEGGQVVAVNDGPFSIPKDSGDYTFDVLENDHFEGTPSVSIDSQTGPGTAVVSGLLIKVPTDGVAEGTKEITYLLSTEDGSDTAVLTVVIAGDIPIAVNDTLALEFGGNVADINVAANDTVAAGALTVNLNMAGAQGTAVDLGGGIVRYTPPATGNSPDVFQYTITDSTGQTSNIATVTVNLSVSGAVQILSGEGDARASTASQLTPTKPTTLQDGDEMYLHVAVYESSGNGNQSVPEPGGWGLVHSEELNVNLKTWIFHRSAGAGEEGQVINVSWSADGSGANTRMGIARCYAVRGHSPENSTGDSEVDTGTSIRAPSMAASSGKTALAFVVQKVTGDTAPVISDITGETIGNWTKRYTYTSPAYDPGPPSSGITGQRAQILLYAGTGPHDSGTASSTISGPWATIALTAGTANVIPPSTELPVYDKTRTPEQHGAVGNGVADDAAALQSLLNWVRDNAGPAPNRVGIIFGAGKTYRIKSKISIASTDWFYFIGNGATIDRHAQWDLTVPSPIYSAANNAAGRMMDIYNCDNAGIFDLTMDGRRSVIAPVSEHHHCIQARNCDNFVARRCTFKNGQGDGVHFTKWTTTITPSNYLSNIPQNYEFDTCVFSNNTRNGMSNDWGYNGLFWNCQFLSSNGRPPCAGIDLEPLQGDVEAGVAGINNVTIDHCRCEDNGGLGLQVAGGDAAVQNITVRDTIFVNNGQNTGNPNKLWRGHVELTGIGTGNLFEDCVFQDLTVGLGPQGWKAAIHVKRQRSPAATFRRCEFYNNSGCSTLFELDPIEEGGPIVIENCIMDVSTGLRTGTSTGASQGHAAVCCCWSNATIQNNTIIGLKSGSLATEGIRFDRPNQTGSRPDGATATGNELNSCQIGIHIVGGTDSVGAGHGINTSGNTFPNTSPTIQDDT